MSTSNIKPSLIGSVIDLKSVTINAVNSLFQQAFQLKKLHQNDPPQLDLTAHNSSNPFFYKKNLAALLFFEPSTRTRFSFESGCIRSHIHPLVLDGASGTSLEKGETFEDTILNIEAMRPLFFVIRCPDSLDLRLLSQQIQTPIINAGWGMQGHPTQALLDMMTCYEQWGSLESKKILFLGDVKHSRIVKSHHELSQALKYQIAYCCPQNFLPHAESQNLNYFNSLDEAISWADAVITLRVQNERHNDKKFDLESYILNFRLETSHLSKMSKDALILHPGPINYGVEITKDLIHNPKFNFRSQILKQVENGVFLRQALIQNILKGYE